MGLGGVGFWFCGLLIRFWLRRIWLDFMVFCGFGGFLDLPMLWVDIIQLLWFLGWYF